MEQNNQINEKLKKYVTPGNVDSAANKALQIHERRFNRLKRTTIFSWAICFLAWSFIWIAWIIKKIPVKYDHHLPYDDYGTTMVMFFVIADYVKLVAKPLLVVAIIMTVLLYINNRSLTIKKINVRLASIEEQLKKITESFSYQKE